jgi:hypothetical protein
LRAENSTSADPSSPGSIQPRFPTCNFIIAEFNLTSVNGDRREVVFRWRMLNHESKLARCDQHIADLALRIAELKETSSAAGSGFLDSRESVELLQGTLDSWQEHKRTFALPAAEDR